MRPDSLSVRLALCQKTLSLAILPAIAPLFSVPNLLYGPSEDVSQPDINLFQYVSTFPKSFDHCFILNT